MHVGRRQESRLGFPFFTDLLRGQQTLALLALHEWCSAAKYSASILALLQSLGEYMLIHFPLIFQTQRLSVGLVQINEIVPPFVRCCGC